MEAIKVKIVDIRTGVVKEVKKSLAGDYLGTGNFKLYEEKVIPVEKKKNV